MRGASSGAVLLRGDQPVFVGAEYRGRDASGGRQPLAFERMAKPRRRRLSVSMLHTLRGGCVERVQRPWPNASSEKAGCHV